MAKYRCDQCAYFESFECADCKKGEYFYKGEDKSFRPQNDNRKRAGQDYYYGRTIANNVDEFLDNQELNRKFWE